jgi:uncharacterized protein
LIFMKKISKVWVFIIITFVVSFGSVEIFKYLGFTFTGIPAMVFGMFYMFIPMLSAILIGKVLHKENIKKEYLISFNINRWFFAAIAIPVVLAFASMGVSLLFSDVTFSPDMEGMFKRFQETLTPEELEQMRVSMKTIPIHPLLLTALQGIVAGLTINAVAGFGEELGWRGFLLREFKSWSFIKASVVIGFIWGIWHTPIILMGHNYPQHPQLGVAMMVVWCILLAVVFNYVTIKTKSVVAAAVMHGTLNGTAGVGIMMLDGGTDLTVGVTGFAGFIALFILILLIYLYDRWISKEKVFVNSIENSLCTIK